MQDITNNGSDNLDVSDIVLAQNEESWKDLLKSAKLTELQMLHTVLTLFMLVISVLFVLSMLMQVF